MNQEDRETLKRSAKMSAADIGGNENNVKYRFIIPFLHSFGYEDYDFEHSAQGMRIDIVIKSSGHKILIEAKGSDKNLDDYIVSQLKRYCDEKRPILALITNGEEIRFYSPFWRKADFNETLIYSIIRHQLSDDDTIEKIERVLGKDGSIVEHIEEREKEISSIKKEIQSLESSYQDRIAQLASAIRSLEEQDTSLQRRIEQKKADLSDLEREMIAQSEKVKKGNLLYVLDRKPSSLPTLPGPTPGGNKTPLGRKGHELFLDYLIPVIRLIKSGKKHTHAFSQVAERLPVAKQTVQAQCTTRLNVLPGSRYQLKSLSNSSKAGESKPS